MTKPIDPMLVCWDADVLRIVCSPVDRAVTGETMLWLTVKQMIDTVRQYNLYGLSAPQIGVPIRIFVLNTSYDTKEHVFINPRLTSRVDCTDEVESCASFPGIAIVNRRPQSVCVAAENLRGDTFNAHIQGPFARVVDHEMDHLDGITFLDHLKPETKEAIVRFLSEPRPGAGKQPVVT